MKIARWIVRIVLFILVLVLVLNNMQRVQFNFYGIYTWNMPLIVLGIAFLIVGLLIGILLGFIKTLELRSRIKLLTKDLDSARKAPTSAD